MRSKSIFRKSGLDCTDIFKKICIDMCRGIRRGNYLRMLHEWESSMATYPLIDHESVWKLTGMRAYFIVSHSYWNDRSEMQFNDLKNCLDGSDWTVVSRHAIWGNHKETPFRQVFIFGKDVPISDVLAMPYDRFDIRCSRK